MTKFEMDSFTKRIYLFIANHSKCTSKDIIEKLKIHRATVGKKLKKLKDKGYISYELNKEYSPFAGGRCYLLTITKKNVDFPLSNKINGASDGVP